MIKCKEITLTENLNWENLIAQSQTVSFFQQKNWLQIWLKHFPTNFTIIGLFDNDNLIGLAPFSYDKKSVNFLATTPVFLDQYLLSDFGDIICQTGREKEVWQIILQFLTKKHPGKTLQFNFVRENSPSFQILKDKAFASSSCRTAPYLNLPKTWENYLASLSRKDRHELNRKLRRLSTTNYRVYFSDLSQANQQQFFQLMRQSSKIKENFLSKEMENFFSDFIANLNKNEVILWFMDIDGQKVASALAFKFKDEILLYNSGMDLAYKKFSVGLLSKVLLIKKSIELGFKKFDFLQGNERYKYDLGAVDNKLCNLSLKL